MENKLKYHKVLINIQEWIDIINANGTFIPENIMEIGSLNGSDCFILENEYNTGNVIVIEAHPIFAQNITIKYPDFQVYNLAASNSNGIVDFNGVRQNSRRLGISSIHERTGADYIKYRVEAKTMESFMQEHSINEIDMLKIDVEGHSFQVLEGFGDKIKRVKSIHIENEHIPVWTGQKLYADVERVLIDNGFILTSIKSAWPQTDSVWIRNDLFNNKWWRK